MNTYTINCSAVQGEAELWRSYLLATSPQGAAQFGCNIEAFKDAVIGDGPGWPGECELHFSNTASLKSINSGVLYQALQSLAGSSSYVRIRVD